MREWLGVNAGEGVAGHLAMSRWPATEGPGGATAETNRGEDVFDEVPCSAEVHHLDVGVELDVIWVVSTRLHDGEASLGRDPNVCKVDVASILSVETCGAVQGADSDFMDIALYGARA